MRNLKYISLDHILELNINEYLRRDAESCENGDSADANLKSCRRVLTNLNRDTHIAKSTAKPQVNHGCRMTSCMQILSSGLYLNIFSKRSSNSPTSSSCSLTPGFSIIGPSSLDGGSSCSPISSNFALMELLYAFRSTPVRS